ncbi:MAG: MFS transporter [Alphaproteobacteria bacterium]|nr:MFS transporter [Alphaproteobacteria bacterium]
MLTYLRDQSRFLRRNGRWIGGGFLLTMFSSFGQTFFIGLSGNHLRAAFDLSGGEFGGLYMVATLGSALSLPWLGRTLDIMPGWKVVRFAMPLLAVACVLIAFAPNVVVLAVSLYMLRLFGQGMMTEIAFTETGRWFVANRGRAMSLVVIGLQAGNGVLPLVFVLVSEAAGWRSTWLSAAALLMLAGYPLLLALLRVERVPQSHEHASKSAARTARDWLRSQVIRDPILYLLLTGTLAPPFIGTVIFFHQGYLIALRGYDPLVFAAAFPVMAVTTVVFGLVCGHLVDRFGALRLLPFFLAPLTVASLAVGLVTPVWGIYLFMFLLGVSNGFTQTLMGALWPEVYGLANLGAIRGITVSAMVLSTALGPGITGALMDLGVELPTQMVWMAGWCVLASFALAAAARKVQFREGHAAARQA